MIAAISEELQKLQVAGKVLLYKLDLAPLGINEQYYLSPFSKAGAEIAFEGQTYDYAAVHITDVTMDASGEPASPRLFIPNGTKFAAALVTSYQDFVGARVTRIKTLETFLDGGPLATSNGHIHRQVFIVEQKRALNREFGEFALRPLANLEGVQLPRGTALRGSCSRRYRIYSATESEFVYDNATCPYVGSAYFTRAGVTTLNPALDVCGKDVASCELRFPTGNVPIRAFPGLSRVR